MKETEFINQNKTKWSRLEQLRKSKKKDPEALSDLFVEVTNDLSYAKSYYPNRSIRVYLNNVAMMMHASVYRAKDGALRKLEDLGTKHVPEAYWKARYSLLIALVVFLGSVAVGAFSANKDSSFVGLMLSPEYVEMTMENIEDGRPMDVYAGESQMDMFVRITLNNIRVAFNVFVLGILFMIGSIFILIQNGAMIGAFHHIFYDVGHLGESLLTVWMHGTPEIGAIILSGAAGLELGKGIVFPGTYERREAFVLGARRGMLMMLPVVGLLFYAGIIESFLTRYTDIPDLLRALFIAINVAMLYVYFVWVPRRLYRKGANENTDEQSVPEQLNHDFKLDQIKNNAAAFSDSVALYTSSVMGFVLPGLALAVAFVGVFYVLDSSLMADLFSGMITVNQFNIVSQIFHGLEEVGLFFNHGQSFLLYCLVSILCFGASLLAQNALLNRFYGQASYINPVNWNQRAVVALVASFIFNGAFFWGGSMAYLLALALAPIYAMAIVSPLLPQTEKPRGTQFFLMLKRTYGRAFILIASLLIIGVLMILFFNSALAYFLIDTIVNSVDLGANFELVVMAIGIIFGAFLIVVILPLYLMSSFISYWSVTEMDTARDLKVKLARIGERDHAYGLLRE